MRAYRQLLRHNRNFRLLWTAQIVSELGDWFYSLAVYQPAARTHRQPRRSRWAWRWCCKCCRSTFVSPTAGVVNDRISRKAIMIGADVARFFIVLGMLLVRTPGMVWLVYPLLLLETIGVAFFEPAHSAVIPNIVAPERGAGGQRAVVHHVVVLPGGGRVAGRRGGGPGWAATPSSC